MSRYVDYETFNTASGKNAITFLNRKLSTKIMSVKTIKVHIHINHFHMIVERVAAFSVSNLINAIV